MEHSTQNQRQKVLVIAHGDGFIEVFAERSTDAKIVTMPSVQSQQAEILAEQLIEANLPRPYRDIYFPINRRAIATIRSVSVADIAAAEYDGYLLSALKGIGTHSMEASR